MKNLLIAVICTTLFTACGISEQERTAQRIERDRRARTTNKAGEAEFERLRAIEIKAARTYSNVRERYQEMQTDSFVGLATPNIDQVRAKMYQLEVIAIEASLKVDSAKGY